jgi:hypothetical protein
MTDEKDTEMARSNGTQEITSDFINQRNQF